MNIKSLIEAQMQNITSTDEAESQITVRLPTNIVVDIEELAFSLDIPRNQLLSAIITEGLQTALDIYENDVDGNAEDLWVDDEQPAAKRFVILNSNKRHSMDDHRYISGGIAAAFKARKHNIDRLRKGDQVLIYENRVGIIGIGTASGETIKNGEVHEQVLSDYSRVAPLSAKTIKKIIGNRNLKFRLTMFKLKTDEGLAIEKNLQRI